MEENIRKFKLIKTYTGCLINIGEIVIKHNNSIYFPEKGGNGIDKRYVENYSEFWQEVIEKDKDYEILSFIGSGGLIKDRIYRLMSNKQYGFEHTNTHSLEWMLSAIGVPDEINPVVIYSVKRLSDNQIFSIGDNVQYDPSNKYTKYPEYNKPYKINKFYFDGLGRLVAKGYNEIDNITNDACVIESKNFRKVERVPLFKSEDGINIYENDKFWFVAKDFTGKEPGELIAQKNITAEYAEARFSTKEKALEYIIENKPCLSYNDIKDIAFGLFMNVSSGKTFFNEEAVKELVKLKLK